MFFFRTKFVVFKTKKWEKKIGFFFPSVNSTNFALYVGKILLNFQSHKTEKKNPGHTLSYGYTKDLPSLVLNPLTKLVVLLTSVGHCYNQYGAGIRNCTKLALGIR
jgi:hypothetical protein